MRVVSRANDGIWARCWQNPCGCGAADVTVEDNSENGMSRGRGGDVKQVLSLISNQAFDFYTFCLCRSMNVSLLVWIPRSLDFGIINPLLVIWTPRLCQGGSTLLESHVSVISVFAQPLWNCQTQKKGLKRLIE